MQLGFFFPVFHLNMLTPFPQVIFGCTSLYLRAVSARNRAQDKIGFLLTLV